MELNVHKVAPTHKLYPQYYLFTLVKYNLSALKYYNVELSAFISEIANLNNIETPISESDILNELNNK